MTKETKMAGTDMKSLAADMMAAFEAYKEANDTRLAGIEAKGSADTLLDEKLKKIDRRLDQLSLKAARPVDGAPSSETEGERSQAWSRYLRSGDESGLSRLDIKSFSAGTDDQGGYTAPPELDRMIEARLMQASPMRQIASVRQTSAGVYRKPVSLGVGAAWAGETDARTQSATTGLSLLEFPAGELYSMPAATQTLLEDTYADIDEWLADEVEAAFSIQESAAFVSGDGDGKPKGFLDYTVVAEASHAWGQIGSVAGDFTEADAGSDASALRTRAERVDGGYVLNGSKQFISSGRIAGLAIVFAVTDPAAGKKGIRAFLVPTDRPGYVVDKVEHKLGQLASDTCSLRFDGLRIEDSLRLGAEGQGYRIALSNLEAGRIGIAAQCIGMARAALEIAAGYAKERRSMGKAIIDHQAVGFCLADLAARLEAARQLVLHAAAVKDSGAPCLKEASMAKLVASETAEAVCSGAIQTLGGYGYLEEFGLAKIYRDVRVCQIYEGTSDIQRMVIARSL